MYYIIINVRYNIFERLPNNFDSFSANNFLKERNEIKLYTYMEAILYCLHCKEETKHIIIYENKTIKRIKCQKCKIELEINEENLKEKYANEYIEKILTEPQKITDEIQKNLCNFLLSLPIRIMVKPYKLIKEIGENVTMGNNMLHSKIYHKKYTK